MAIIHEDGDQLSVLVGRLAAAERRISELEKPTGTQNARAVEVLTATVAELQETVDYLESLTVVSAVSASSTISVGNDTWTSNASLRPSLSVTSSTGKLKVTVSAFTSYALATFSIPGYVDRDAQIAGSGWLHQLQNVDGGAASKSFVVAGLPVGVALTVQAEVRGLSTGSPLAGHVSLIAEVIP